MTILCNSCGKDISGQALTTSCSHCFCLDCANQVCQGDNSCPVCGSQLDGSNVSVETCGDSEAVLRSLRGSSPEEIIMVVSEALVFNETQRHLANELQAKSHKGKCKQIVDSSKAKMAEMHKSYKNLVQKAKSISQDKAQKQAMLEELRKKAQESSRICRKLQEQLKAQQTKSTIMHQQLGLDHGLSPISSGVGRLPGMNGSKMQSQALVPSRVNRSHGHIPHTVCAPHQKLLRHHSHSAGPSALRNSSGMGGMKRIMPPSNPPASPTLGGAPTPSDGNGTSISGRSGSGVSMLLGNARRPPSATGSDPLSIRRNTSSPRNACGSLSDLIKSRKRCYKKEVWLNGYYHRLLHLRRHILYWFLQLIPETQTWKELLIRTDVLDHRAKKLQT